MNVTVKEAIRKGIWFVNVICFFVYVLVVGICFYLFETKQLPWWGFMLSFVFAIIPTWIYWSFSVVKWRIWAFKNVRNVHQLYESAILNSIIWKNGSYANKTELWTSAQRKEWETILKKFDKQDVYVNRNVASETVVKHSKVTFWTATVFILLFVIVSIYLINKQFYLYSILSLGLAILFFFDNKKRLKEKFVLIINEKGITTQLNGFVSWEKIEAVKVVRDQILNKVTYHLKLFFTDDIINNYEEIEIKDFSHSYNEIDELLRIYKQRYISKNKQV